MATYRILSLDGGGTWALLQVMALQKIYKDDTPGREVLEDFNLVAANGAGCITLAGLLLNKNLDQILKEWFLNARRRQQVLAPPPMAVVRWWNAIFGGAKYSTSRKRSALQEILGVLGQKNLTEVVGELAADRILAPQILLCAYDCDRNRAEFFRSDRASLCASATAANPTLLEAVHAATTAPSPLFDRPAEGTDGSFWDGAAAGLYNPVLAAVTEARANRHQPSDIRVLSIGTGTVQIPHDARNSRLARQTAKSRVDGSDLLRSVLYDPADPATFVTHVMLDQPMPGESKKMPVSGNVIRLCPVIRPLGKAEVGTQQALSQHQLQRLASLELDAMKNEGVELIRLLGQQWVAGNVPNQAIRSGRGYSCEIGHETFAEAVADWKAITTEHP